MLRMLFLKILLATVFFMSICFFIIHAINVNKLDSNLKLVDNEQKKSLVYEYNENKELKKKILQAVESVFAERLVNYTEYDIQKMESILANYQKIFNLLEIYIAPLDGRFISSSGYQMNALEKRRPWFIEIIQGSNFYQSDYYQSEDLEDKVVTVSIPIKLNGKLVGVAGLDIFGGNFDIDQDMYVLTDQEGNVFSTDSKNSKILGKNIYNVRPDYLKATITPTIYKDSEGDNYTVSKHLLNDGNILFSILPINYAIDQLYTSIKTSIFIFGFFSIILMFVVYLTLNKELKMIREITLLVKNISEGKLSETTIVANYEFGEIIKSVKVLTKRLLSFTKKSQNIMSNIKDKQKFTASLVEKNQNNSLNELSFVEKVDHASSGLALAANDLAKNASDTELATTEAKNVIDNSLLILKDASDASDKIMTTFFETKKFVNQLRDFSTNINSVVEVIDNISEQTNLLALNAAIEAARAGAQGKGFAVVAEEVRALAAKTQKSTIDIKRIISELQNQSNMTSSFMDKNVELVERNTKVMNELSHFFGVITEKVMGISNINSTVVTMSEEQNHITKEIAQQLEMMKSLVQQNLEGLDKTIDSNSEVTEFSKNLEQELSFFKIEKNDNEI